ncbi:MAG: FAD binding domain-containing protein [Bacteroidetes bacterium]|nr:FAD binding domain-containing protein [Bacteroidota bacterium]
MVSEKIYVKPKSVEQAIKIASQYLGSFRYLAGGTDVIVNKYQGNEEANCLIDITEIEELKKVSIDGDYLKIGSLIKLDDLKKHESIVKYIPTLIQAAHEVASPILRKTATIGGNILCENRCSFYNQSEWWREAVGYCLKCDGEICIATGGKKNCFSKFVSDTAPVLIALNARLEIIDTNGESTIALEDIYSGDGMNPRKLSATALIRNIQIPIGEKQICIFKKLRPREAVDFTSLTTAVSQSEIGRVRIVLGGVDPKPIVVEGKTTDDKNALITSAVKKARIVDNDVYSRQYRKEMISVYLQRSFDELKWE